MTYKMHLAIGIELIKQAFLDAKSRGARLRYLTEVTIDNISYCKMLRKIVDELRHLDGMKGNFMISESEYLAPAVLEEEEGKIASQLIYSNVDQIVEQHQYMFDTLWSKAIPSEQRIREIDEGVQPVSTRILEDQDQIINEIRRSNSSSSRVSICSAFGGMQMSYKYLFESYVNVLDKHQKGEGEGMRWIINIDKEKSVCPTIWFLSFCHKVKFLMSFHNTYRISPPDRSKLHIFYSISYLIDMDFYQQ